MVASGGGGGKPMPSEKDGQAIARVISNELDTAKFDPLLVKATAKGVVKCLELLQSRVDNLVRNYIWAYVLFSLNDWFYRL